jgi:hypothetical protein
MATLCPIPGWTSELVAVSDVVPELLQKTSKDYSFRRQYADWHDLINDPQVTLVDICTPNVMHREIAVCRPHAWHTFRSRCDSHGAPVVTGLKVLGPRRPLVGKDQASCPDQHGRSLSSSSYTNAKVEPAASKADAMQISPWLQFRSPAHPAV